MPTDESTALIRAIIENMRTAPADWASLAMVVDLDGDRVAGTHGYVYTAQGVSTPTASRPSAVAPAVEAFLESRYAPGQPPPRKLLVQFDRDAGTYEVTFEDTDATRWKVTPANIRQMAEEIRPDFS